MDTINGSSKNISDSIVSHILSLIKDGDLKPGDKIPSERELSKSLMVSRSSIREAIERLQALGYLETKDRSGTFVSSNYLKANKDDNTFYKIKLAPILDLMEVRMILELNFFHLIINNHTKEDINNLKQILNNLKIKNEDSDFNQFELYKLDLDFHVALAKSTHNMVIIELMKVIFSRIEKDKEYFIRSSEETIYTDIETFEALIEAIENKNTDLAVDLYKKHLNLVTDTIKEI